MTTAEERIKELEEENRRLREEVRGLESMLRDTPLSPQEEMAIEDYLRSRTEALRGGGGE